jgi:hypothetical protein
VQASTIELPDLLKKIDEFTCKRPSSFVRLVYESAFFTGQPALLLGVPFSKFVHNFVLQVNPFIEKYWHEPLWAEFISKYELMVKEKVTLALRNPARKRRYNKRFFNDL